MRPNLPTRLITFTAAFAVAIFAAMSLRAQRVQKSRMVPPTLRGLQLPFLLPAALALLVLLQNERAIAIQMNTFNSTQGLWGIQFPDGSVNQVQLTGSSTVQVDVAATGATTLTNGSGLDEVTMQMTQLNLSGNTSFGPITVTLDPARPTAGETIENVNSTPGFLDLPPFTANGSANSFFDVFAEITVGPVDYHTLGALYLVTTITHEPPAPGETYANVPNAPPVPLLDPNGNPTGVFLLSEQYTPNPISAPEPSSLVLAAVGFAGLIAWGWRRRKHSA